jgi:hypothetical protein
MSDALKKARIQSIKRQFKQLVPGDEPMEISVLRDHLSKVAVLLASLDAEPSEPNYPSLVEDALDLIRYEHPVFVPEPPVEMNPPDDGNSPLPRNWLAEGRAWKPNGYWARYRTFLEGSRSPAKLDALNATTDSIIGHSGNPEWAVDAWDRRGVVVGQVQSGKTETDLATNLGKAEAEAEAVLIAVAVAVTHLN